MQILRDSGGAGGGPEENIADVVIHPSRRGAPLMTAGDDLPTLNPRRNGTAMITMLKVFFVFLAPVGPQPVLRVLGTQR